MRCVPIQELSTAWPAVESLVGQAVAKGQGDESLLDVLIALAQGKYSLWIEPGVFAAVAQVVEHPRQKVATILYLGGADMDALKAGFEAFRDICRKAGVDIVRIWGREGWERALGIERVGVILQCSV